MRRAVKAWLTSGVMDDGRLFPTTEGSPQGGVISPLLANVALHGLETAVRAGFTLAEGKPTVIRYADDFVVLHPELAAIERARDIVTDWLTPMGLELKPSKTRITHTLHQHDGHVGFDFLGCTIRQHPAGKHHAARVGNQWGTRRTLGFKTIITPSREALTRHTQALATVIARHQAAPQAALVDHLNPIIRGWTRYYATVSSKRTFSTLSYLTYLKLRRWATRRHPRKGGPWIASHYWHPEQGTWTFATKDGVKLFAHHQTPIRRHVKVRGTKSPYDGDWAYWTRRLGTHPLLPTRVATLLQRQQGRCARCGLYFRDGDLLEVDHITPLSAGGSEGYRNWQLLHRHCHDQKTAEDGARRP